MSGHQHGIPVSATLIGPNLRGPSGVHLPAAELLPQLEEFIRQLVAIQDALQQKVDKGLPDVYEVKIALEFYNNRASAIELSVGASEDDPTNNKIKYTMSCYCNGP